MQITDNNGKSHDVTGSGQGLYNTIAGSIGALGALGGGNGNGGLLGGLFGGGRSNNSDDQPLTRYDANLMQQMQQKDMRIAILEAGNETKQQMVEVYNALNKVDNQTRDRIDAMGKELLDKITVERESRLVSEKEQAVFNQTMIGTTSTMASQIKQLNTIVGNITTNVVPQSKVCDTCCGCND